MLKPSKETLRKLQYLELDVENEKGITKTFNSHLLAYNDTWGKVDEMLDRIMTKQYREQQISISESASVDNTAKKANKE